MKTIVSICRASSESLILNWQFYDALFTINLYNVPDFEIDSLKRVRRLKDVCVQKILLRTYYSLEATFFALSLFFPNAWFFFKNFSLRQIRKLKNKKKSFFRLKFSQGTTIWTNFFTTCQILSWIIWNVSEFEKHCIQKSHLLTFFPCTGCFSIFEDHDFEIVFLRRVRPWNKITKCVRFWIKNFKTSHSLKKFAFKKSRCESCYSEKTKIFALFLLVRNERVRIKKFTMRQTKNSKIYREPTFFI